MTLSLFLLCFLLLLSLMLLVFPSLLTLPSFSFALFLHPPPPTLPPSPPLPLPLPPPLPLPLPPPHYTCTHPHIHRLRNSTWLRLQSLQKEGLSKLLDNSLKRDPLYPVLTQPHLTAIDRRLDTLLAEVRKCVEQYGHSYVFFDAWPQSKT